MIVFNSVSDLHERIQNLFNRSVKSPAEIWDEGGEFTELQELLSTTCEVREDEQA